MRPAPAAIVIAAAIVVGIACGGRHIPPNGDPRKNEITALSIQIRDWRREAGLPVDPRPQDVFQAAPLTVDKAKQVCPDSHPVPPVCFDVCSLAEAICDNAEQICILADELGKDDKWAQDKCASAKASCRDAKKRCCTKCTETDSKASATW